MNILTGTVLYSNKNYKITFGAYSEVNEDTDTYNRDNAHTVSYLLLGPNGKF